MWRHQVPSINAAIKLSICSKVDEKPLSCAGSDMLGSEAFYDRLRRLAVEDPKEAKRVFLAAFESNSEELRTFFAMLDRPSEGRLRQLVANAVRSHPEKRRVVPQLFRWRESETDEFTRRAIEGALGDVDPTTAREGTPLKSITVPSDVGDI